MEKWKLVFSKRAEKDWYFVSKSIYKNKVVDLLNFIEVNPFSESPPVKQLKGDLKGFFSRRINQQHRLVYRVDKCKRIINITMIWLHYDK
ncbi:MAG: Txe/YoeB family addiction module toxin [Alkaliphilus sp.]